MQETLYQQAFAEVSLSDIGCRRHSIRQRMQESLYQTADAGALYLTADAEVSLSYTGDALSDSGCRRHSISQRMQESLYQTADAGDTL